MGVYVAVKVVPRRLTLSYIPNCWLVFIQYTTASLERERHSSGSLVSDKQTNKKRWSLEVGAQPLWIMFHRGCATVPVLLKVWTLVPQIIGEAECVCQLHWGPGKWKRNVICMLIFSICLLSGMLLSDLQCQRMYLRQTNAVYSVSHVQALWKCWCVRCGSLRPWKHLLELPSEQAKLVSLLVALLALGQVLFCY